MATLKQWSPLTDDVKVLAVDTDLNELAEMGEFMASGREPNLIVFVDDVPEPKLRTWGS